MISGFSKTEEGECEICGSEGEEISQVLSVCLSCIRRYPAEARRIAGEVHGEIRGKLGLPPEVPDSEEGSRCDLCGNHCEIPEGGRGYCGLSENEGGEVTRSIGTSRRAVGSWYRDSHPTNCVAAWRCAGGTGAGYPKYAKKPEGDEGYKNAAIFLGTCCYHCLYCQNTSWHRMATEGRPVLESDELVDQLVSDQFITCACWFGGTPEPQAPFVLEVSRRVRERAEEEDRIFRICLESNGNFSWEGLKKIARISLESGGGIKFDLKTWDENLNYVLSGAGNGPTYENFERLGKLHARRGEPAFLRASTPMIPGYIDLEEIGEIAGFIADVDVSIPYSLLAFGPAYKFGDQPRVSRDFASRAKAVAEGRGLENVRIGNKFLLA